MDMVLFLCHKKLNFMKTILLFGITTIATFSCITPSVLGDNTSYYKDETDNSNFVQNDKLHDWECKYIIVDSYSGEHKNINHYVNYYTSNVDGSISFISHTGKALRIPYPYFYIIENNGTSL